MDRHGFLGWTEAEIAGPAVPGTKSMADGRRNSQGQHRGTEKRDVWLKPLNALQVSMDLLSPDKTAPAVVES